MLHSTTKYISSTGTYETIIDGNYDTEFMEALSSVGKMLSVRIHQGGSLLFDSSSINSCTISVDGGLLKSLMKTVEIELNGLYLLLDEEFSNIQIGVSGDRGQTYYYANYGKFIVGPENEQIIDTNTTKITCYDEMINAMKSYKLDFEYSAITTNKDYFDAIAAEMGLTVGSSIPSDGVMALYRNQETYTEQNTYRDVLDDFAEILGGCIIVKDSKLELVKPTDTNILIDEEQLKSVNYKEIYNQVTNITLSRMPQEDNVNYPTTIGTGESIKLENNLLVEGYLDEDGAIDRTPYLEPMYNAISAWGSYYPIELESFGYCLYEPCDVFHISVKKADGTTTNLPIIWMSNVIKVSQGLDESMESNAPESGETDYTKSSSSAIAERNTYLYVDKVNGEIRGSISDITKEGGLLDTKFEASEQGILTTVSETYATQTDINNTLAEKSYATTSQLQQTKEDITGTFTTQITNTNGEIDTIKTWIKGDANGVTIGKSDSAIKGTFTNSQLQFTDKSGTTKYAWLDANDGLGATMLSIGSATTARNRWRIFVSEDGSHLTFTRHS